MISRQVNVYRVSSMVEYVMDGEDETAVLVKALNEARSDLENPMKKAPPDCKYVAVITSEQGTVARRYHFAKKKMGEALIHEN